MTSPLRLTLFAPDGRMGRAIARAAAEDGTVEVVDHGDVLVDFSAPAALHASLARATATGMPLLIGTTGLGPDADSEIAEAAREVAILRAANTSLGVALLTELVERASRVLATGWDIEVLDTHHRMKADAPSGTALALGEAAARGRGIPLAEHSERGRDGVGLKRGDGAIGFAAVRGGSAAGDHDVLFLGPDERLILSHRAESRAIFARGAIAAARFLAGKPPGLYTMRDVIGAA